MKPRKLSPSQSCQIRVFDVATSEDRLLFQTDQILFEAPNWSLTGDALYLNGDGLLWRVAVDAPEPQQVGITGTPHFNNDHVLDPDGTHVFLSTYDDWQIYRAPLKGGPAQLVSRPSRNPGLLHFLHGVSPDGKSLAFVGVNADMADGKVHFKSAEICTMDSDGGNLRQITHRGVPNDGPEYSPDGQWIYFNSEAFSGHAQIARMRVDGSGMERLKTSVTVDWFPHVSPDGKAAVYLAFPPGTRGHPANLNVSLMLVHEGDWANAQEAVKLFGGQGTINVNSWSPESKTFAYVAYPFSK